MSDMPITKTKLGYKVEGGATHKTRATALRQLRAIKASQHTKKKG